MNIPKFDETFLPILQVLRSGRVLKTRELIEEVKSKYYSELNEEQLKQETKSGDLLIDNRIAWGKVLPQKRRICFFSNSRKCTDNREG